MNQPRLSFPLLIGAIVTVFLTTVVGYGKEISRPEEIRSKRQVVYSDDTYVKLARLWKDYDDAYPSEYAYANWMYAARYAHDEDYSNLLAEGLSRYPANPTLLYLRAMQLHGSHEEAESRKLLERAAALAPMFVDPWFSLVTSYMALGDQERLNLALRRLLESGYITDDIMDYNFNVLAGLDSNAVLVTNGDNDTYPGWILIRILKVRPDVTIVNRSLLNTEWYPNYLIGHGLPQFIEAGELSRLREKILAEKKSTSFGPGGPFGDTLVTRIIQSAERANRPVYLAKTLYLSDMLREIAQRGRDLGLATLVTAPRSPWRDQLRRVFQTWLNDFRTVGLQSWRLKYAPESDAARFVVRGYAYGMVANLEQVKEVDPELRPALFQWYIKFVDQLLDPEARSRASLAWCRYGSDVKEIEVWCRAQGIE